MNKESLEERLKELETSRDQLKANFIAHEGAILECKNWLEKVEKKVSEEV